MTFYVGTYTDGESEGIYTCSLDPATGALAVHGATGGIVNPSFLALDGPRRHLYAVSETSDYQGSDSGAVSAFRIGPDGGALALLNTQPSQGGAPCHLTVDATDRYVLVANYTGGNAAVLPIEQVGSLGAPVDVVQHEGKGPNARRQQGPHAHSVNLDAANRFAFVADLGIDKVMVYRFDAATGRLMPGPEAASVQPGAGPRHFAFHPDGGRAYVINELDSTVTAFAYDAAAGRLTPVQTLSTLPDGFSGESYCADIHVAASGRFVYGSNRGHNSIVVFAVGAAPGTLSLVQHQPTGGEWPRNFALDPTGRFLLVANQNTGNIVVFTVDAETGRLSPAGQEAEVPSPVCIRFV